MADIDSIMKQTLSILLFIMSKKAQDPGWEHAYPPIEKDRTQVKCKYCQNEYNGGMSRFKRHLAGIRGDVAPCAQVPEKVKEEMSKLIGVKRQMKEHKEEALKQLRREVNITDMENYSDYETGEVLSKRSCVGSSKSTQKGLIDRFCIPTPEEALRRGKNVQPTINEKLKEKERERTIQYIARWFYEVGIPFNAASLESFSLMLEAIGQYGRGLKAPTPYELRVPLLKKEVEETKAFLKTHRDCWEAHGCSIMTDAWTDKRGWNFMNLVVNCELGSSFLRSIDSSLEVHVGPFIFKLVSSCIDEIGEENVVQVISNNASANMAAANLLRAERPNIFWTPCAAYCIDLMLEDIGKFRQIKNTITKARMVTVFLYGHMITLSMMRKFAQKKDLVRTGVTRFATAFLSLQSIMLKRNELRTMFTSKDWDECKWSKMEVGKRIQQIVLSNKFWNGVSLTLKAFEPLVYVLQRVDGDKVPSIAYVYGDLENAKKEIALHMDNDRKK
ncbi:uncharacterized protein LOC109727555 [Ananas comosus]|uniref:Uncharacterized protein LOC109727555 n=1 Tax=Ananas comosus TaxID=4615 RepID=A0A6P5GZM4_ANACO|nr:uncharacterized protein LOC109727555 [Ananas comosus]